ncbi:YTH domain-containing protein ECT4-like isoform X1 [Typha latifolia]|uniref:YTH domain-containing protein ECT4-like isoform X1 n=1 Tax=Typha latifolia TaxID=4733 RepID=UPI003C2FCC81
MNVKVLILKCLISLVLPSSVLDSVESLEPSTLDVEQRAINTENSKEQPLLDKDEKIMTPNISIDLNTINLSRDAQNQVSSSDGRGEHNVVYPPNLYAPHPQTFFYGGYENPTGEWEEYPHFLNIEGLEVGSAGVYNENPPLMFHTGYGYSPQMPYGPYSPVTTPLPSASGDNQLYSPQHFPFSGPYYQQSAPPNIPYLSSPTPLSQADPMMPIDPQGAFLADTLNSSNLLFGPMSGYHLPYGGFGRDWLKPPDGTGSMTTLSSPAASPQPIGVSGPFGQSIIPLASGMASPHQRSAYGFGSSNISYDKGYPHGGLFQQVSHGGPIPNLGNNGRGGLIVIDKARRRGKGNALLCSCNGSLDFLNEQNRGPRATRPKKQVIEQNSPLDNKNDKPSVVVDRDPYNSPDFVTEYKDAKFFIIKSYSEDNVHKSIKYNVWASTANGNRKLNSAYREAKEKEDPCPVFLFFSVNASGQFCGVAEMIGPVDFEKSVDYWQQDKWTGQFPVKWHIVKDVPNNLFRHIILENNENKPVTNSRDTQEVKLEQGLEMLSIFKKHEADMSILEDFDFYEEREKAMQENRARQQQQQQLSSSVDNQLQKSAATPVDLINQISKNFAHNIRLEESNNADPSSDRTNSGNAADVAAVMPEDAIKPE